MGEHSQEKDNIWAKYESTVMLEGNSKTTVQSLCNSDLSNVITVVLLLLLTNLKRWIIVPWTLNRNKIMMNN